MTPNEAINVISGMRVFLCSRQIVKQPEGSELFDEAVSCLREAVATAGDGVTELHRLLEGFTITVERNPLMSPATYLDEVRLSCEFQPGQGRLRADAIRAALASRPVEAAQGGAWLPIETAPSDDTMHVRGLHVKTSRGWYFDAVVGFIDDSGDFVDQDGDSTRWAADDFTHWHPLAAAPEVDRA